MAKERCCLDDAVDQRSRFLYSFWLCQPPFSCVSPFWASCGRAACQPPGGRRLSAAAGPSPPAAAAAATAALLCLAMSGRPVAAPTGTQPYVESCGGQGRGTAAPRICGCGRVLLLPLVPVPVLVLPSSMMLLMMLLVRVHALVQIPNVAAGGPGGPAAAAVPSKALYKVFRRALSLNRARVCVSSHILRHST